MALKKVALCHFEFEGEEYNYGDEVPEEVEMAFPTAVGFVTPPPSELANMSQNDLVEALNVLTGKGMREEVLDE